ncbi:hypothetical protein FCM30_18350 [Lelliottia aquatilis]|uniref:hypothetical protein n=1 Tax=Lelliottia aquatilis TaxID=2080838 RepID=UPI001576765A|nr:hypothetical protein [Lelliottia aquatilis]NTZ47703.1 hypothetical protein [Lelliottia aquatilis]
MKTVTILIVAGCVYASAAGAAGRCEAIASSLIRAAMITPISAYDFRSSEKQLISMCNIGSDAAEKGENIHDAIIGNLKYRNEMAAKRTNKRKQ